MKGRPDRRPETDPARWSSIRDVLCVRLDTIGDVLMCGPAMRALHERARVTLLTSPSGAAIAQLMPEVDETIVYPAPWMKGEGIRTEVQRLADQGRESIERLREHSFDAAVIFTVYSQSALPAALLCLLAGIPLRLAHSREKPYALLTDWVPEPEPDRLLRHEVRRQLDLVATVGARTTAEELRLRIPRGAQVRAARRLAAAGLEGQRWVAVHLGGTAPARRYPPELLAQACAALAHEHDVRLVFTGDSGDRQAVNDVRVHAGVDSLSLAGELDLGELAAVLESAAVLVCGNTGPVHLAAAVGTPVVDLYALTNPQHTPWGVPSRVLFRDVPCRWCYSSVCPEGHHRCLRGVAPNDVARAAVDLLREPVLDARHDGDRQVAEWGSAQA
jgi:lipopolysaccharide heptosyltransferase II